ncbi:DUF779 domain-containing protein [Myroides odoratus]|jgi:uncharacterized protein (DUF779 family)|uniref:DUF779 domain-containing protein n=1 Tax=Myroides odoratus TaxID=256 RepID=A0A9Q6Z636_MYROD|nr:DUF779 domain-containing protein [Myroides odoratus]EHQ43082.1 protein of unknown function DUF779 [Myroides odoratus DSM 2801]EKB06463.1 hypothetical protein HMPREF9716_02118 [Myroides odoratus CIP 103059]MDR0223986.1 DUF779 domain-containing protein [Myroides odoratus]QQU00427.1 DUF779 domain-containing protein [Myroides odoratus]WQD57340.1 DUF779 domain-containing protein [Myroides odoratus]
MSKVSRIDVTEKAKALIQELQAEHGDLMFYQAGGCCEGTQPMCFVKGGYYLRRRDVKIGEVCGFDFWVDRDLFEYWKHAHFTLDVTDGFGAGGFSLEVPKQKTFQIHYRMFTPEELPKLEEVILNE